ncbi:transposase, partial [Streptococcus suis]
RIVHQSVYTSLKKKVPQLLEALDGYFSDHHRFMLKQSLEIYDFYQKQIELLEERMNVYLSQYENHVEILDSIPGIDVITASVIISEVGVDMSQFPTAGHRIVHQSVYTSLKKKVPQLLEALDGYFSDHHRFMLKQSLEIYDFYQKQIELLEERMNVYLSQYENHVEILDSIPGIDVITASVIISEGGVDMSQFPTAGHRIVHQS